MKSTESNSKKNLIVHYLKETTIHYNIITNGIIADSISALRDYGITGLRHYGIMALRHYGITALRHYGITAHSNYGKKYGNAVTVLICKINSTTNYTSVPAIVSIFCNKSFYS